MFQMQIIQKICFTPSIHFLQVLHFFIFFNKRGWMCQRYTMSIFVLVDFGLSGIVYLLWNVFHSAHDNLNGITEVSGRGMSIPFGQHVQASPWAHHSLLPNQYGRFFSEGKTSCRCLLLLMLMSNYSFTDPYLLSQGTVIIIGKLR